jgi:hypothetical protein
MIIIHSSGNLSANYSAMRWDKGIFNGSVGENGMKPDRIKDGTDVTDVYHKTTEEMERERDQVKGKASAQDLHVQKTCCPGSNLDLVAFVGHSSNPCKLTSMSSRSNSCTLWHIKALRRRSKPPQNLVC